MSGGSSPKRRGQRKAAALRYDEERDRAPVVMASGRGHVAERILEVAREASVPIVEDAALVGALLALEVGEEIPPELYQIVVNIYISLLDLAAEKKR